MDHACFLASIRPREIMRFLGALSPTFWIKHEKHNSTKKIKYNVPPITLVSKLKIYDVGPSKMGPSLNFSINVKDYKIFLNAIMKISNRRKYKQVTLR